MIRHKLRELNAPKICEGCKGVEMPYISPEYQEPIVEFNGESTGYGNEVFLTGTFHKWCEFSERKKLKKNFSEKQQEVIKYRQEIQSKI